MGSVFGGFLADAGHSVVMIARKAHADAIAEKGLLIDGIWGTRRVRSLTVWTALADISDPASFDAVLLSVKSYDTALALSEGSETRAPMAITVIGGLILSTLLTLIVIPVTFTIVDDIWQAIKRRVSPKSARDSASTPRIRARARAGLPPARAMAIEPAW